MSDVEVSPRRTVVVPIVDLRNHAHAPVRPPDGILTADPPIPEDSLRHRAEVRSIARAMYLSASIRARAGSTGAQTKDGAPIPRNAGWDRVLSRLGWWVEGFDAPRAAVPAIAVPGPDRESPRTPADPATGLVGPPILALPPTAVV